jgi:DNA-binding YbaB/EbfC family protein
MRQAQKLQAELVKAQQALEEATVEVTAGGGAITVVVNGVPKVKSIKISPDVIDPDDVEMLEDLVTAAVNEGLDKARELQAQKLSGLTGGLGFPGLR